MLLCRKIISTSDKQRLVDAVAKARSSWLTYAPYLESFSAELRRAEVLPPNEVPADVITMNSRIVLTDPATGESNPYMLVYPDEEMNWDNALSVLTPLGTALLGTTVGEEVCWISSAGPEVARVNELQYQPEAAGHFRL